MPNVTPILAPRLPDLPPSQAPRATAAVVAEPAVPTPSALPNPTLRLDASLGLVVLEFRDADGGSHTIPSERELEAYRSAARGIRPGATPGDPRRADAPQAEAS